MEERPTLEIGLDSRVFRDFYYLKEELVTFCKAHGLPTTGGKIQITQRIAYFLDTGKIQASTPTKRNAASVTTITKDTMIEENFVCSQKHRAFFEEHIGATFSFPVAFQKWLKSNAGKTYQDAILAYAEILEAKKTNKTSIDRQFEYNTYIRDFFADNKGKSLQEAITCWKYKKQQQGHNRYEASDLRALSI